MSAASEIIVNGAPRPLSAGATVADLLTELGITQGQVAVERNGEVVPRAEHGRCVLAAGDRLEVVAFCGGG